MGARAEMERGIRRVPAARGEFSSWRANENVGQRSVRKYAGNHRSTFIGAGMNSKLYLFLTRLTMVLALLVSTGMGARAQSNVGAFHGQVTDSPKAVVVGASVIVTGADGAVLSATTNQQGTFDLKGVAPGIYKVEIFAKGFAGFTQEGLQVSAGQIQQVNAALEIEAQQQQVTVTDQSAAVDVSPTSNAGAIVINGAALDALPDDPDELQTDLTALAGPSGGPNGGGILLLGVSAGGPQRKR